MNKHLGVILILLCGSTVAQEAKPLKTAKSDGKSWWEHVKVLADDKMAGRETGSEGLRRASEYVVQQLTRAGLQPAGNSNGARRFCLRSSSSGSSRTSFR